MITQETQILVVGYNETGKDAVLVAPSGRQLAIYSARAFNRSGSTIDVGLIRKFSPAAFLLWTYDGSVYTSAPLLSVSQNTVNLTTPITIFPTTTTGKGMAIQSKTKFGFFGYTVSTAGSTGVYTYQYWNGSSFTTLTTIATTTNTSTGDTQAVFLPPSDWVVGGGGALDSTKYTIRVITGTAPATGIQISNIWVGQIMDFYSQLANNTGLQLEFDNARPFRLEAYEGIMPYFGGSASPNNGMTLSYSTF